MFITGPDVIKTVTHEEVTKEDLGGAVAHTPQERRRPTSPRTTRRRALARRARAALVPAVEQRRGPAAHARDDDPARARTRSSTRWSRTNPNKPYDIKDVIRAVVDDGTSSRCRSTTRRTSWSASRASAGGRSGVVANQPAVLAGCLDIDASMKAARFVRFCDCFNIPLVTFVDVPGFLPGTDQEYGGIIKHGAKLLYAFAEATVPKVTVITRKAYGGAYDVMASKHIRADVNFAYPTAEIAVMGPEGAVNIVFRDEIAEADRRGRRARARSCADYREKFANPYKAAELGYIDEVIYPEETRRQADPRARAAEEQAAGEPAEEAREHPAVTTRGKLRKILIANRGEIAVRVIRDLPRARHRDGRGLLRRRSRRRCTCVWPTRRYRSGLRRRGRATWSARRSSRWRRDGRGRHPPRLRLPLGERGVRAGVRGREDRLHRPAGRGDGRHGREDAARAIACARRRCRSCRAARGRSWTRPRPHGWRSEIGFPVMLKAAAGGGGKGMRRVERAEDFQAAWRGARGEAKNAFGDDSVYLEKYLDEPRHVEIQVFADRTAHRSTSGRARVLGAAAPPEGHRGDAVGRSSIPRCARQMGEVAVRAAQAVGYVGAGTVEFLVDARRNFYFLEMNTRLQVEHPVTEW